MTRSLVVWGLWLLFAVGSLLALEIPAAMGIASWHTLSTTFTFLVRKTGPLGAAVFIVVFVGGMALFAEHINSPETFDKRRRRKVARARATLVKHGETP